MASAGRREPRDLLDLLTVHERHLSLGAVIWAAVAKDPQEPLNHYHLGMAYFKLGEKDKARQTLKEALNLKADFPGVDEVRSTLTSLQ